LPPDAATETPPTSMTGQQAQTSVKESTDSSTDKDKQGNQHAHTLHACGLPAPARADEQEQAS